MEISIREWKRVQHQISLEMDLNDLLWLLRVMSRYDEEVFKQFYRAVITKWGESAKP